MNKRKGIFKYRTGNVMLFGVTKLSEGVQFAVYLPDCKKCCLKLYRRGRKTPASVVELTDKYKMGSVYLVTVCKAEDCEDSRRIEEILSQDYEYMYEADGVEFVDPYADYVTGREVWCRRERERGGICIHDFSWGEDVSLRIPYSDLILYQLHVRGYTKHGSSKVQNKGTFRGLIEKLPYLKDLGINGVLLLPVYEFSEVRAQDMAMIPAKAQGRQKGSSGKRGASAEAGAAGSGVPSGGVVASRGAALSGEGTSSGGENASREVVFSEEETLSGEGMTSREAMLSGEGTSSGEGMSSRGAELSGKGTLSGGRKSSGEAVLSGEEESSREAVFSEGETLSGEERSSREAVLSGEGISSKEAMLSGKAVGEGNTSRGTVLSEKGMPSGEAALSGEEMLSRGTALSEKGTPSGEAALSGEEMLSRGTALSEKGTPSGEAVLSGQEISSGEASHSNAAAEWTEAGQVQEGIASSGAGEAESRRKRGSAADSSQPGKQQSVAYASAARLQRQRVAAYEEAGTGQHQEEKNIPVNYWGYGAEDIFYFAPKAAYTSKGASPSVEFKELVRAYHEAGIEVLLDIHFTPGTNLFLMIDCLRSWVLNYHVDGFRVNQEVMPSLSLASDPILSGVKILCSYWDGSVLHSTGIIGHKNELGEYNEGFMNDARRFLKSDEGMVGRMAELFRRNSSDHSYVNFMTHVNGFTMMDLVSYDIKHNEANGERNKDGTEFNYSWNCGVEGKTRKKLVTERRMVQIRNAFAMLLTSQGTPMILAGDEFGNTQFGNNNPYCQDNPVTWLQWNQTQQSELIRSYVKNLILFRKSFSVLHQEKPLTMMDTLSCGMPDLSVHGVQAWRPDYSNYSRMLALLYYGAYVEEGEGRSVYIIYNMFWESRSFDLPHLPNGRNWKVIIDTYDNIFEETLLKRSGRKKKKRKNARQALLQKKTVVPPRSIVVFVEE